MKDQPILTYPFNSTGLTDFDFAMLDHDPGVVNAAITKEVRRRLGSGKRGQILYISH